MEFSVSMRAAPQVPSAAPPNLRIVFDGLEAVPYATVS
jgi:hypothetical protein